MVEMPKFTVLDSLRQGLNNNSRKLVLSREFERKRLVKSLWTASANVDEFYRKISLFKSFMNSKHLLFFKQQHQRGPNKKVVEEETKNSAKPECKLFCCFYGRRL